MLSDAVINSLIAGIIASLCCGLGALPFLIPRFDPNRHAGPAYALASGLMLSATTFSLILPGIQFGDSVFPSSQLVFLSLGMIFGGLLIQVIDRYFHHHEDDSGVEHGHHFSEWGGRTGVLIFIAMTIHSIPEGLAVGVGYTSDQIYQGNYGLYIATAIAVHNIPEGLAVAIPMRAAGVSIPKCFVAAFLTSLPQPIAAVPAAMLAWFFKPIMPLLMGLAAGAMIFLVIRELIPAAIKKCSQAKTAWYFLIGFIIMMISQAAF